MRRTAITIGLTFLAATSASAGHRSIFMQDRDIEIETRQMNRAKCLPDFHRLCPGQQARNNAMARCLGHLQRSLTPDCSPVVTDWCNEGLC